MADHNNNQKKERESNTVQHLLLPPFISLRTLIHAGSLAIYIDGSHPAPRPSSRVEPLRVPREQRRPPDIVQLQEQHQHAFQANSTSPVRSTTQAEGIHIRFHRVGVDTFGTHFLREEGGIMDSLGT
jgi:hypothetical protein